MSRWRQVGSGLARGLVLAIAAALLLVLAAAALLAPFAVVCALVTVRLIRVIDPRRFYWAMYLMIFAAGVFLIGQAAVDIL